MLSNNAVYMDKISKKEIYLVKGFSGTPPDIREWNILAFDNKTEALEYTRSLQQYNQDDTIDYFIVTVTCVMSPTASGGGN